MARLLVFRGDLVDREIDLGVTSIRIGRGADNDVVLDDPEKGVSRTHAELRFENGRYVLVDLGSQNGIFQDGARVERAHFRPNSAIVVGSFQLMIDESAGWPGDTGNQAAFSDATVFPGSAHGGYAPADYNDPGDSRAVGPPSGAHATSKPGWLRANAKPVMFGGGAIVLASAIGLGAYLFAGGESGMSPDEIAQHITDAEDLIDQGQPARAISEHLDKVLGQEPDNADALEVKREAEARLNAGGRAEVSPPPLPPPPPPSSGTTASVAPPSSPPIRSPAVDPAERDLADRIADASRTIERGEIARADEQLRALPAADPRVADLQRQLRQRRRGVAEDHARQAAEDARGSRWAQALDGYERARQADPTFPIDAPVAEIRGRVRQEVDRQLPAADVEFRFADDPAARQKALRLYEDAARLLTLLPDHPRSAEVAQRIRELRGK